jgi:hypothetical protein
LVVDFVKEAEFLGFWVFGWVIHNVGRLGNKSLLLVKSFILFGGHLFRGLILLLLWSWFLIIGQHFTYRLNLRYWTWNPSASRVCCSKGRVLVERVELVDIGVKSLWRRSPSPIVVIIIVGNEFVVVKGA